MGIQLDLLTVDGATHLAKLPKATGVAIMEELNGDGQLSFTVAVASDGAGILLGADEALVKVSLDGDPVGWGVLDRDGDDPTEGAGRSVTVTAPGTPVLLGDAIVYADVVARTTRDFVAATPGGILVPLLTEAQARGCLQGVAWAFDAVADSNGVPWPQTWTGSFELGATVRSVLQQLTDNRLADFRMVGLTLELYVADTYLDRDMPGVRLLTPWLTEAPRERTRQGKVTDLLVLGDGGRTATATSPEPGRRREGFAQAGGIPDQGTLELAADAILAPLTKVQQGYTVSYATAGDRPTPWADYRVGDSIRRDDVRLDTGGLEPLRVRSMSVELADNGATAVTLELNDVFLEAAIANKLRLDALTNGAIVGQPAVGYGVDRVHPAAPTAVTLTSDAYALDNGEAAAQATISWPPVSTNDDGTVTDDVAGYEAQLNINGLGFGTAMYRTTLLATSVDALPISGTVQARVRAVDKAGNPSVWQLSDTVGIAHALVGDQHLVDVGAGKLLDGDLAAHIHLTTGKLTAGDPAAARAQMDSEGLGLFTPTAERTVRGDAGTGQATWVGEVGTAPPGDVGTFMYSNRFSWAGSMVVRPVVQMNVGATRDQPSIQADTTAQSGLWLYSGANAVERETWLFLNNGAIQLGIEESADVGVGSYLQLDNTQLTVVTNPGAQLTLGADLSLMTTYHYGAGNHAATLWSFPDSFMVAMRNEAGDNVQGMQVVLASYLALRTAGSVQVTNPDASAWKDVDANAFNALSARAAKHQLAVPRPGLDVLRAAPAYEYAYLTDDTTTRRVGPMADDLPAALTRVAPAGTPTAGLRMASLMDLIGVLWQAVGELDAELDRVPSLRSKAPARKARSL